VPTAELIVCDWHPSRATALRLALEREGGSARLLRQCQSLEHCRQWLSAAPASFVAVAADSRNLPVVLGLLTDMLQWFPSARAAVLADRAVAAHESALREAGSLQVVYCQHELGIVAKLAKRHLERFGDDNQLRASWLADLWPSLPWPESAGDDGSSQTDASGKA